MPNGAPASAKEMERARHALAAHGLAFAEADRRFGVLQLERLHAALKTLAGNTRGLLPLWSNLCSACESGERRAFMAGMTLIDTGVLEAQACGPDGRVLVHAVLAGHAGHARAERLRPRQGTAAAGSSTTSMTCAERLAQLVARGADVDITMAQVRQEMRERLQSAGMPREAVRAELERSGLNRGLNLSPGLNKGRARPGAGGNAHDSSSEAGNANDPAEALALAAVRQTATPLWNVLLDPGLHRNVRLTLAAALLEHGADCLASLDPAPAGAAEQAETPWQFALRHMPLAMVKLFFDSETDFARKDVEGNTMLHDAAMNHEHPEVLQFLLGHRAAQTLVGIANNDGILPLHVALSCVDNDENIIKLLETGPPSQVLARTDDGETALHIAVKTPDSLPAIRLILAMDMSVINMLTGESAGDDAHASVLHHAVKYAGDAEVVLALLQAFHPGFEEPDPSADGAFQGGQLIMQVNERNRKNQTALELAADYGNLRIVNMLLHAGADPNSRQRALFAAAAGENLAVLRALLDSGVSLETITSGRENILHAAAHSGRPEILQEILQHGKFTPAWLMQPSYLGNVPLHHAAHSGNPACMSLLLEAGPHEQVDVQNHLAEEEILHNTPLHLAARLPSHEAVRQMLRAHANVYLEDRNGHNALMHAAMRGCAKTVALLLDKVVNFDEPDRQGMTALSHAVQRADGLPVVKMLLAHPVSLAVEGSAVLPLHLAAAKGSDPQILLALMRAGANPHALDGKGNNLLHYAAMNPDASMLRYLLENGARELIDGLGQAQAAPLHRALMTSAHADNLPLLLANGANVHVLQDGLNLLHCAAVQEDAGKRGHVKLLVEAGVDINARVEPFDAGQATHINGEDGKDTNAQIRGLTPLQIAIDLDDHAMALVLIEHGADALIADDGCPTILHSYLNAPFAVSAELVEVLLQRGVDGNLRNEHGDTALHIAARADCPSAAVLKLLLEQSEDVNARNNDGDTALHLMARSASLQDQLGMAKALLEHGASIALDSGLGRNAVFEALHTIAGGNDNEDEEGRVIGHKTALLRFLLEQGIDVDASDAQGDTALHLALRWHLTEIVTLLLEFHASTLIVDRSGVSAYGMARRQHLALLGPLAEREPGILSEWSRTEVVANDALTIDIRRCVEIIGAGRQQKQQFTNPVTHADSRNATLTRLAGKLSQVDLDNQKMAQAWVGNAVIYAESLAEAIVWQEQIGRQLPQQRIEPLKPLLQQLPRTLQVFAAAATGDAEFLKSVLATGSAFGIDSRNDNGQTLLNFAASRGHADIVQLLLGQRGITLHAADDDGLTPLFAAARNNHGKVVELLLAKDRGMLNAVSKSGIGLLGHAASHGNVELAAALLEFEALDVNLAQDGTSSPLHRAISRQQTNVLRLLLNHPDIDVGRPAEDGRTALEMVLQSGNLESARVLFGHPGIDINAELAPGMKALHIALSKGSLDMVRVLLSHQDIDVNAPLMTNGDDMHDAPPLHLAIHLTRPDLVRALLADERTDINRADALGRTPLHRAMLGLGTERIIRMLLGRPGIDVNQPSDGGYTPLYAAVHYQYAQAVDMLLESSGIDIHRTNPFGQTVLDIAAMQGNHYTVKQLLKHRHEGVALTKALLQAVQAGNQPDYRPQYFAAAKLLLDQPEADPNILADMLVSSDQHPARQQGLLKFLQHAYVTPAQREAFGRRPAIAQIKWLLEQFTMVRFPDPALDMASQQRRAFTHFVLGRRLVEEEKVQALPDDACEKGARHHLTTSLQLQLHSPLVDELIRDTATRLLEAAPNVAGFSIDGYLTREEVEDIALMRGEAGKTLADAMAQTRLGRGEAATVYTTKYKLTGQELLEKASKLIAFSWKDAHRSQSGLAVRQRVLDRLLA
ncbi:MAG: ankyrin repeat domain-containing protein [Janthinobacterium lividum]